MGKVKGVVEKHFIADDGRVFVDRDKCVAYEKQLQANASWYIVRTAPDLNEGCGFTAVVLVEVAVEVKQSSKRSEAMLRDFLRATYGRDLAFVQGCVATERWMITSCDRAEWLKCSPARFESPHVNSVRRIRLTIQNCRLAVDEAVYDGVEFNKERG